MKILSLFKKDPQKDQDNQSVEATGQAEEPAEEAVEEAGEAPEEEVVTLGTKIKVVAALAIVGFATYVAYWVQEPTDYKAQLLTPEEQAVEEEDSMMEETSMQEAAAEEETPIQQITLTAQNSTQNTAQETNQAAVEQEVAIIDFTFTPANITIEEGTTVVWTNLDTVDHTVTGDLFTSDVLESGDSFSYTFEQEGSYDYFCSIHPQMTGSITVTAGTTDSAETLPESETTETTTPEETLSPQILTTETDAEPTIVTIDPQELLQEEEPEVAETVILTPLEETELRLAAEGVKNPELVKSGPEDVLYVALMMVILYVTRRKILPAHR